MRVIIKESEEDGYRQKPTSINYRNPTGVSIIRTFEHEDLPTFFLIELRNGDENTTPGSVGDLDDFCILSWEEFHAMKQAFEMSDSFLKPL